MGHFDSFHQSIKFLPFVCAHKKLMLPYEYHLFNIIYWISPVLYKWYLYTWNMSSNSSDIAFAISFKNSLYGSCPVNANHFHWIISHISPLNLLPSSLVAYDSNWVNASCIFPSFLQFSVYPCCFVILSSI